MPCSSSSEKSRREAADSCVSGISISIKRTNLSETITAPLEGNPLEGNPVNPAEEKEEEELKTEEKAV